MEEQKVEDMAAGRGQVVDYQTKGGGSLNEDKRRRKQNMRRRAGGKVRLINVDADNNQEEMD